ncbi:MAG: hypothetical protein DCC58_07345 [Chloroflexi bacterium]|nr:MAG: hypothetical protein DCC58_07345 [Chloroflexota bacterium]
MGAGYDETGKLEQVFARIERLVSDGETDAAALAVGVAGQPVAAWYAGHARPELPAGPHVYWPLASISKLYTAATVMALVERGELYLSLPVHLVLPEFAGDGSDRRDAITLRQLLTHTSGLLYESPNMEELLIDQTPLDALIAEGQQYPLDHAPGSAHQYSDYGFALLGKVAATVTGVPFPELVRSLVLEPAGLQHTSLQPAPEWFPFIAQAPGAFGWGTDGAMYNSPYALRLGHPAFGVVATLADLLRFGLLFANRGMLDGYRVLSRSTVRAMTSNHVSIPGAPAWGLGFELDAAASGEGDLLGPGSFGHGGATGCTLWHDSSAEITIAFVSNRHYNLNPVSFARRLSIATNGVLAALT